QPSLTMSTYSPAVSNNPSMSRRLSPLSITCVRPTSRGFGERAGTSRNPSEPSKDVLQSLRGVRLDVVVERVAVGVDPDRQRAEVAHSEPPEALRHQLLPRDFLDLFDLGRLERGGAADDREVDHSEPPHRLDRLVWKAALA